MSVTIYARIKPMTDAVGRADYISNPDRQEHLLAVSGQNDSDFWRRLSLDAQAAWRASGGARERAVLKKNKDTGELETIVVKNKACEAREVHVALPRSILEMDAAGQQEVADKLQQHFTGKYGVDCLVGLHMSKTDNNVHAHILFSERQLLPEPETRRADRNAFIDQNGVRKRTKKEILDDDGQLRPGCKIIKKGEILSERYFCEKDNLFADKDWAKNCKADLAAWINEELHPDQERVLFDQAGPYLAQIHIGKGRPEEQADRIREHNRLVKQYNAMLQVALESGQMTEEQAMDLKTQILLSPDRGVALKELANGQMPHGGQRTSAGKEEMLKRQLREHYKQAATARKNARAAKDDVTRKVWSAEARKQSQVIDQLKIRLGYLQAKDEKERRQWEERERQMKHQEYWRRRVSMYYCNNRIRSLKDQRKHLVRELWNCGIFDFEGQRRLEKEIESMDEEIAEAEEERRQAKLEAKMLRGEIREIRAAARAERSAAQKSVHSHDRGR